MERKKRGRPRKNPIEGEELLEKRARINEGELLLSVPSPFFFFIFFVFRKLTSRCPRALSRTPDENRW